MPEHTVSTVSLLHGAQMPALGLGTSPMNDDDTARAVEHAVGLGYRLVDTAENYGNEVGVGRGLRAAGVTRADVFLTTKFNHKWHSVDGPRQALEASLERLGLDYVDLLLIHWPNPDQGTYVDAWRGVAELLNVGLVRAIGTSNFKVSHLQRLLDDTGVVPDVNQIQLSPHITRTDRRDFHIAHGIVTESWSPLGNGGDLLAEPAVQTLAQSHERAAAQIVLRWHVQHGLVPIPKSSSPDRLAQNLAVFDFELAAEEMALLDALDRGEDGAQDSDVFGH